MVEPAAQKAAVDHLVCEHRMSERRACRLLQFPRATKRYQAKNPPDDGLRQRLGELARQRQHFGYRRLTVLLEREGRSVNHKRVYRLYRELGLALPRKRRRRLLRTGVPQTKGQPSRPNQHWAMDFVSDTLATGQSFRALALVDKYTRECPALEVDTSCESFVCWSDWHKNADCRKRLPVTTDPSSFRGGYALGAHRKECCCATLTRASRCRTGMPKALTGGFGRSA